MANLLTQPWLAFEEHRDESGGYVVRWLRVSKGVAHCVDFVDEVSVAITENIHIARNTLHIVIRSPIS